MAKLNTEKTKQALIDLGVEIPKGLSFKELAKLLKAEQEKADERLSDEDSNSGEGSEEEQEEEGQEEESEDNERLTPESELEEEPEAEDKVEEDYLLKYQYGSDDDGPMKYGDPRTCPAKGSKAETMKKALLKQPKVKIIVPKADGEDPTVRLSVNLNGYRLDFPKNTYLDVPEQIADVIIASQKQQTQALQPFRIDRDQKTEDALG